jgi:hypothetical protein
MRGAARRPSSAQTVCSWASGLCIPDADRRPCVSPSLNYAADRPRSYLLNALIGGWSIRYRLEQGRLPASFQSLAGLRTRWSRTSVGSWPGWTPCSWPERCSQLTVTLPRGSNGRVFNGHVALWFALGRILVAGLMAEVNLLRGVLADSAAHRAPTRHIIGTDGHWPRIRSLPR